MPRDDVFKKPAKSGDVPLGLAQFVEKAAAGVGSCNAERAVEGKARPHDAQLLVEHHQRLADSVKDSAEEGLAADGRDRQIGHLRLTFSLAKPNVGECLRQLGRIQDTRRQPVISSRLR